MFRSWTSNASSDLSCLSRSLSDLRFGLHTRVVGRHPMGEYCRARPQKYYEPRPKNFCLRLDRGESDSMLVVFYGSYLPPHWTTARLVSFSFSFLRHTAAIRLVQIQ